MLLGFLVSCDCKCIVSLSDKALSALCCENVKGGEVLFSVWFILLSWAELDCCRDRNQGVALHSPGHLLVRALVAVGKAVCKTIFLWKLSGPTESHYNSCCLGHTTGEQSMVAPVTISSDLCRQNFGNFLLYVPRPLISPVVILFWSKTVCVAVCRLELNAADWNLNCDLAVANCESAAELPIKPCSSSHFRFLSSGLFLPMILFVSYVLKISAQPFFNLCFVLVIFFFYCHYWCFSSHQPIKHRCLSFMSHTHRFKLLVKFWFH